MEGSADGGDGDVVEGDPPLTVAVVARRLGVAPATLRTWARRYGLGPSGHAAGAHRRYSPADLARLQRMRRLTHEGVSPAEAARAALAGRDGPRTAPPATTPAAAPDLPAGPPDTPTALLDASPVAADPAPADPSPASPGPVADVPAPAAGPLRRGRGRGGPGGRVLALPGADATVRGLGRAAMALDSATVLATVRAELARHGVVRTWDEVLRPVLSAVGARWAATGDGIEVEHLLADCVVTVLREVSGAVAPPAGRPVLLACAPDEQHVLPLHAVAAGLAERGLGTRVLGAAMPASALEASVRRTGPAVLFLWSQRRGTADHQVLGRLPVTRPPTAVVVGGPGWRPAQLPSGVALAHRLDDALDLVAAGAGTG